MPDDSYDPMEALANAKHEFGEHGGVNMSIEASTTFTVLHANVMPEIFGGRLGPDTGGCYLYGRHFNPTVFTLGKQLAAIEGAEQGLFRLVESDMERVIALGPAAPREFEVTIAGPEAIDPLAEPTGGRSFRLEDGLPDIRRVSEGRAAHGRGWLGLTTREAYVTTDVTVTPFISAWLFLLLAAGSMLAGWLREGRQ